MKTVVVGIWLSGEDGGKWHIRVAHGTCTIQAGPAPKPNAVLNATSTNFVALLTGELDGTKAFMSGKLCASGNVLLLAKFGHWFNFS